MGFLGESASHDSCFGLPDRGWHVVADRILWVLIGRTAKGNSYHCAFVQPWVTISLPSSTTAMPLRRRPTCLWAYRSRTPKKMKPPRVYTRGILPLFGAIRRSTLLRSLSFGGSDRRIHPWANTHGLLRRRTKGLSAPCTSRATPR